MIQEPTSADDQPLPPASDDRGLSGSKPTTSHGSLDSPFSTNAADTVSAPGSPAGGQAEPEDKSSPEFDAAPGETGAIDAQPTRPTSGSLEGEVGPSTQTETSAKDMPGVDESDVELEIEDEDVEDVEDVEPIEEIIAEDTEAEVKLDWYILKVQSNREKSICDALARRVAVAELDRYFGDILVPTEDVAEFKNGKRRVVKRKLYPGYIVVNMALTEETWFLVRETPGIGDFTGSAGKPTPMMQHEIDRIVKSAKPEQEGGQPVKTAIPFKQGDRVRIKDGTFENFEGDVDVIDEANGRVTVMINIFGRSTPVELEHWQVDAV